MFNDSKVREIGGGIPSRALTVSLAVHVAVLAWLCWQPEPMLIQREAIMAGENGTALGVVYLPTDASLRFEVNEESNSLKYAVARKRARHRRHIAPHQTDEHPTDAQVQAPLLGSRTGDALRG